MSDWDQGRGTKVSASPGGGSQGQSARILIARGSGRPQLPLSGTSATSSPSSSSRNSSYTDSPRQGPSSVPPFTASPLCAHPNSDLSFAYDGSAETSQTSGTVSPVVIVRARDSSQSSQSMVGSSEVARDNASSSSSSSRGFSTAFNANPDLFPRGGRAFDTNSISSGSPCGTGTEVPATQSLIDTSGYCVSPSRVTINPEDYLGMRHSPRDDSHTPRRIPAPDSRRCRTTPRYSKQFSIPPLSFQSSSAAAIAALTAAAAAATGTPTSSSSPAISGCSSSRTMIAESPLSSCREIACLSPVSSSPSTPTSPLVANPEFVNSEMAFVEASQPIFSVDGPKDKVCATMFEGARKETFYLLSVNFYPLWASQTQQKMASSGKGDVPMPKNLATVLENKFWLNSFEEFLKGQLALENLRFYQEATKYRETDFSSSEMMELDAQKIFLKFIAPSSTEQINTSAEICHNLCRVLFHKELETVMEEQRSQEEQRSAVMNDIQKRGKTEKKKSSKSSQMKLSDSFGSEHELEQIALSSEEEPVSSRRKSGLFRSLSHFSLHWKKPSDSDNPARLSSTTPRPSFNTVTSEEEVLSQSQPERGALRNIHSYSSINLVQYQQSRGQDLSVPSTPPSHLPKVHRTRSASMGLNLMAADAKEAHKRKHRTDLSASDITANKASSSSAAAPSSATNQSPSSGQSDAPTPVKQHGHHHHSSSSLSARRHGSPLVASVDVSGSANVDEIHKKHSSSSNGTPASPRHSPHSPLAQRKHSSPRLQQPVHSPQQVTSPQHSYAGNQSLHSQKSGKTGSSSIATEGDLGASPVAPPPVLPERLALQDASVVASPHRSKHKHKNRTTPRSTATPMQDPTELTPKNTPAKSKKQSRQKSRSKRNPGTPTGNDGAGSFRRSGSTHSLDENMSSTSAMMEEEGGERRSFRFADDDDSNSATPSPNPNASGHTMRNGSTFALNLRRGSYDSSEARKASLSFSSSEALSDAILSIDSSCTSGDSTPIVSVARVDPQA